MSTTRIDDLRTPKLPVNPRTKVSTTFLLNASNRMDAASRAEVRETTNSFMTSKFVKNSVYFFE